MLFNHRAPNSEQKNTDSETSGCPRGISEVARTGQHPKNGISNQPPRPFRTSPLLLLFVTVSAHENAQWAPARLGACALSPTTARALCAPCHTIQEHRARRPAVVYGAPDISDIFFLSCAHKMINLFPRDNKLCAQNITINKISFLNHLSRL